MKRILIILVLLVAGSGGTAYYYKLSGSPEIQRERALLRARNYMKEAKVNEAVIEYKNALVADPRSGELHYELALALIRRGEYQSAYQELVRATDLNPNLIKARYQLATLNLLSRNTSGAKKDLQLIRQQDEDAEEGYYLAAHIALFEKQPDKALVELENALNKEPRKAIIYVDMGQVYVSERDYPAAEAAFRKALAIDPQLHRARMALAQLYVTMGNQERAEQELLLATEADPENEALLHMLGSFYSKTRRFNDNERLYQDLLKKKPDSLVAKKRLVEIYMAKNDPKQARQYTDEILKSQAGDTDGLYFRGRLNLLENNAQNAVEDLAIVARNKPQFAPVFYFLGQAQIRRNELREANRNIAKSAELAPNWLEPKVTLAQLHLASGDYSLAADEVEQILRMQPNNETGLLMQGAIQLKQGQADKSLASFKQAQKLNPKNPASHISMGAVYASTKKFAEAAREYEEALKVDPNRMDALGPLAQILITQRNTKAAVERLQQHLSKTENQASVYQLLGQVSLGTKDYDKGIEYLEKAIDLNPDLLAAYVLVGNAYAAQNKFDTAIEQYQKAGKKNPKAVQPHMMTGILFDMLKQPQRANEHYQKVLDLNKNFAPAANNLAYNYAEYGGNLDVALGLAQRAREANPNDPEIADTLGWIHYKKGTYATALGLLKESNEKFKATNPTVLYHLAVAYEKSSEHELAKETFQKALSVSQNFPERAEAKNRLESLDAR
jgi:tetratricopeptide (TPR) repeat protein